MNPDEIMVSESQERMLIVTNNDKLKKLQGICKKFRITCSVIGHVTSNNMMHVKKGKKTCANLPTDVVANATLLDYSKMMMRFISSPNIASKIWVYGQYDHEVGIRTVVKPGLDSSVLRLDNGKFLAAKIDG